MKRRKIFANCLISLLCAAGLGTAAWAGTAAGLSGQINKQFRKNLASAFPLQEAVRLFGNEYNNILGENYSNSVFSDGRRLIKKTDYADEEKMAANAELLKGFVSDCKTCYVSAVPTAAAIYSDELPVVDPSRRQTGDIEKFYDLLGDGVKGINLYNSLLSVKNNYIYYRTENVWTAEGAYTGYRKTIRKMGAYPTDSSLYNIRNTDYDYRGSLEVISDIPGIEADYIREFECIKGSRILSSEAVSSASAELSYTDELKAEGMIDNNIARAELKSGSSGKKLLIFKDKWGNAEVNFFIQHYSTVTVIDIDKAGKEEIGSENHSDYDDVLFIFGADRIADSSFFEKLKA